MNEKLCRTKIEENIINVEFGRALTLPLAQLNRDCEFKKVWDKFAGKSKEEIVYMKAYNKAYNQKPEFKAYKKAYNQRPEVKARQKAYYQRPEVKARQKAYQKAYYQKHKKRLKDE